MNPKKASLSALVLLLAATVLFAYAAYQNYYLFQMLGRIKAQLEDPLEAWGESSYMAWQYNSTFYACRNMSTLLVEAFSDNDTDIIQYAINETTTYGGTVTVKSATYTGTYNAAVILKNKVKLVLQSGAAGIAVTIDSGATAVLADEHNWDFKRWDNGVLVSFTEDRSSVETISYTVFTDGTFIYVRNGTTGAIDYTGTNESEIIQTTMDALREVGGQMLLKAGTYTLTAPLIYTLVGGNKYIEIYGESQFGATILDGESLADYALQLIDNVGLGFLRVSDMLIKGGVDIVNGSNYLFRNVRFVNSGANKWNLRMMDVSIVRIDTCWFSRGILGNIYVGSSWMPSNDIVITNSLIYGANEYLLKLDGADSTNFTRDVTISNNYFEAEVEYPSHGIYVYNSRWVRIIGNTIAGRSNTTLDLVHLDGDVGVTKHIKLIANDIWAIAGPENRYGLYIRRAPYSVIEANFIFGQSKGLYLHNDESNCWFLHNNFNSVDDSSTGGGNIWRSNEGFVTEKSGTAEASNDDWISFGVTFAGTPQTIDLTVHESDDSYFAQVKAKNTTHFQLYLYDDAAGAEGTNKTISWYAEYQP